MWPRYIMRFHILVIYQNKHIFPLQHSFLVSYRKMIRNENNVYSMSCQSDIIVIIIARHICEIISNLNLNYYCWVQADYPPTMSLDSGYRLPEYATVMSTGEKPIYVHVDCYWSAIPGEYFCHANSSNLT